MKKYKITLTEEEIVELKRYNLKRQTQCETCKECIDSIECG